METGVSKELLVHTDFSLHQRDLSKKIKSTPFTQENSLRLQLIRGNCMIFLTSHFFLFSFFFLFFNNSII